MSWKLANFARFDPALAKRRIVGATHGSKLEKEVWDEYTGNWDRLAVEGELMLDRMVPRRVAEEPSPESLPEGRTREMLIQARVNQSFFRAAVLAAYDSRCCITGMAVPQLLTASHIVPWSIDAKNRTNPRNGLCLNAIHDRAFDCGLLTVTPEYRVKLSPNLKQSSTPAILDEFFFRFNNSRIALPHRFRPDPVFLKYHNEHVFDA